MSSPRSYTDLEMFLKSTVTLVESYNYIPTVISMVINIFHVFILSRKSISASAVNYILLGIGVFDLLSPLIYIKIAVNHFLENEQCKLPATHIQVIFDWLFSAIRDDFRRCSVWLGLSLAIIRTISIKTATNKNFNFINSSKTGILAVVTVVFTSSLLSVCYVFRYQIVQSTVPWTGCQINSEQLFPYMIVEMSQTESMVVGSGRLLHLILTAIFGKIIPSILFPISAIILTLELRKTTRLQWTTMRKTDKTNRLVVYMTITFIIIELPIGICNLVTATRKGYDDAIIPESIAKLLNMIYVPMASTHLFICFAMSSQYRKTVKNVLGFHQKIGRVISHYSSSRDTR